LRFYLERECLLECENLELEGGVELDVVGGLLRKRGWRVSQEEAG